MRRKASSSRLPQPRSAAALLQSPAASSYSASSAHALALPCCQQQQLPIHAGVVRRPTLPLAPARPRQPASPLEQSRRTDGRDRASARAERNAARGKRVQMLAYVGLGMWSAAGSAGSAAACARAVHTALQDLSRRCFAWCCHGSHSICWQHYWYKRRG